MKLSTLALIELITSLVAWIWFASIIATITFFVLAILDKASWNTFFLVLVVYNYLYFYIKNKIIYFTEKNVTTDEIIPINKEREGIDSQFPVKIFAINLPTALKPIPKIMLLANIPTTTNKMFVITPKVGTLSLNQ